MLLDILSPCLISKTTFNDSGITVNVRRKEGESVRFFVIDEKSNPNSNLRETLSIQGRICDLIVYYVKEEDPSAAFCFVELKGKRIDDALEQVVETFETIKGCTKNAGQIKWKAYILIGIASHIKINPATKRILNAKFGDKDIDWRITKKNDRDDLGAFLRGN
jgi:hypothetical protein